MRAKVIITDYATGKEIVRKEVSDVVQAALLLKTVPDQCDEQDAKYSYSYHTVHDGGVVSLPIAQVFTSVLRDIDLNAPFYQKHPTGAVRGLLDQQGTSIGSAIILFYNYISKLYLVDVTLQGTNRIDKRIEVAEERLVAMA